jgi:hypothetical protein
MKRVIRFLPLAALVAAFALPGCKPAADGGNTASGTPAAGTAAGLPTEATLRLKANEGDTYTLVTTVETAAAFPGPDGKVQDGTLTMTMTEVHKCTKVENGNMTWETKNADVQASGTGPLQAAAEAAKSQEMGKTETRVRDERNRVVGESEEEPLALEFPDGPVKVGDKWSGESTMAGQKMKIEFTVDRFEKVGDKTAAVLKANISGEGTIKTTEPLVVWVNTENGWPLKGEGAFEMNQGGQKATMKIKMEAKSA